MRTRTQRGWRTLLTFTAITSVVIFGGALTLAVAVNILHDNWWHTVPLMSYETALALAFWLALMITLIGAVVETIRDKYWKGR
jgi:ABC-type Fe3+ transport system permease subunit